MTGYYRLTDFLSYNINNGHTAATNVTLIDPLQFVDGATVSGLTYTFTSLASATDDIEFSNDDGANYTYDPGPDVDADGFNSTVTHLRVRLKGVFSGAASGHNPSFELKFKVRVE